MNKLVDEAPYHPGYEDAVVAPSPKYTGIDPSKMVWKPKPLNAYELIKTLESIVKAQEDRIAELEKEVKELHKIAQVMAIQESDARKELQNYKDGLSENRK